MYGQLLRGREHSREPQPEHDAPRMATVRAVTDSRLLMIEREEFLAAATGNAGARNEAASLVGRRLAEAAQVSGT